jgi:hypothetical protein
MSGEEKVSAMLLDFMLTSPLAAPGFAFGMVPPGGGDCDEDVDLADWTLVSACVLRPGVAPDTAECECADFDADGDIDLADAARFQGEWGGGTIP